MKNKFLLSMFAMSMVGLLACSSEQEGRTTGESVVAQETTVQSTEKSLEEKAYSESTEEKNETEEAAPEQPTKYEDFLNGNEKLYFEAINMNYPGTASSDEGYLLSELLELFKDQYWGMQETPKVEYAYIDCGDDGVSELAVRFVGMGIYEPGDDSTLVYIIKEIDEKLELCYCYETWARSETAMNQKGYITSGGSNGASNHGYGAGCIDGTGKWNYLYYQEEEADINQLMYPEVLLNLPRVAAGKNYEGTIVFVTTTFEDMSGPEAYYNTERFYTYYIEGVDGDVYSEGIYKEIFEEAGVKVYRPEEIQQMIADKEALAGVTEAMKNAPEINWEQF